MAATISILTWQSKVNICLQRWSLTILCFDGTMLYHSNVTHHCTNNGTFQYRLQENYLLWWKILKRIQAITNIARCAIGQGFKYTTVSRAENNVKETSVKLTAKEKNPQYQSFRFTGFLELCVNCSYSSFNHGFLSNG